MMGSKAERRKKRKEICNLLALQISFIITFNYPLCFIPSFLTYERHCELSKLEANLEDFRE